MGQKELYEDGEASGAGLQTVLAMLGRRKWPALLFVLSITTVTWTTVLFLPDIFQSSATVLIERQQIPSSLVKSTVTSELDTRLQTISQEILSRARLEGLISQFGLYEEMPSDTPVETIIERMREDITLSLRGSGERNNRTTVAFTLSFRGQDPQRVAAVTNTLASFYIEENLKVREEQASGTSRFLRLQLEDMQKSLESMEQQVTDFKSQHVGELPHQQQANIGTLEQLNTRLQLNSDKQMQLAAYIAKTEEQLNEVRAQMPPTGRSAVAIRLSELRAQLRELRKNYSDKYPDVIRVKTEIANLVDQLEGTSDDVAPSAPVFEDPAATELQAQIDKAELAMQQLRDEADRLTGSMLEYQRRVDDAPLAEQKYHILMRNYETTTELYRSLLLRHKEAELAESMERRQKGEQFRIIDPALPSELPAAPNRGRLMAVGLVLALGLGAGLVLLLEQLDTSFHATGELRQSTSHPVLLSIPPIVTRSDLRRRRWSLAAGTAGALVAWVALVGACYWIAEGNDRLAGFLMQ